MKITSNTDNFMVIDDFLDEKAFKYVRDSILYNPLFGWTFLHGVTGFKNDKDSKQTVDGEFESMFHHTLYCDNSPCSDHAKSIMEIFLPKIMEWVTLKSLVRIKANCYVRTQTLEEHARHWDYYYEHTAGLFSLNTCDGFTRLENGTKIDSVENRMLFFNGSKLHNSTTTTNDRARFNINFNFI